MATACRIHRRLPRSTPIPGPCQGGSTPASSRLLHTPRGESYPSGGNSRDRRLTAHQTPALEVPRPAELTRAATGDPDRPGALVSPRNVPRTDFLSGRAGRSGASWRRSTACHANLAPTVPFRVEIRRNGHEITHIPVESADFRGMWGCGAESALKSGGSTP